MATGFNTQVSNGEYRLQFETDNREYYLLMQETARRCVDGKPVTNADRIRSMSDEELARWLVYVRADVRTTRHASIGEPAVRANIEWLQQPAEEADNETD